MNQSYLQMPKRRVIVVKFKKNDVVDKPMSTAHIAVFLEKCDRL